MSHNPKLINVGRSVERERVVIAAGLLPKEQPYEKELVGEMASLCETAGTRVVARIVQKLDRPHAAMFIGKGKVDEIKELVKSERANAVVFHCDLTGAQIRNLEKTLETKVVDRTEIILDIFASRARTKQAKLQVELAQLEYSLPRLRRMWEHLSRYEGGIGTRGPGEKQLEDDKRIIRDKITFLRRELKTIEEHTQRIIDGRKDSVCVSIVGYTNAGKSTLFNALTGENTFVEEQLFATLDTRTRKAALPSGREILLSDTVGFIRNLPHHLVASFHATLEEAVTADLLLHVVDISQADVDQLMSAVDAVLKDIKCADKPTYLVLNKIDRLAEIHGKEDADYILKSFLKGHKDCIAISAKNGTGLDFLLQKIDLFTRLDQCEIRVSFPITDGNLFAVMNRDAEIFSQEFKGERVIISARIKNNLWQKIKKTHNKNGLRVISEVVPETVCNERSE